MKKVLRNKKYLLLFVLLAVVTVTTVAKLSKSKLFTSLRKDKFDYTEVQEGDEIIDGSTDVTFDVYFLKDKNNDGEAEGYRGSRIEYGKSDKLYFDLNVSGNAILKNGSITFDNKNVKLGGVLAKSSVIPSTLSSTDYRSITLGEVSPGTSSFFYLNVSPYIENDLNSFSSTNRIIFRGTIVNNITGEETPVEKIIEYDVDTYATKISTSINETKTAGSINNTSYEDKNQVFVTYTIQAIENYDAMPMSSSHLTGSVSDFEGYHPTEVNVVSADGVPIEFEYNSENQTFTAVKKAVVNENNIITRQAYNTKNGSVRYNKWYVYVTYEVGKEDVLDNKTASINVKAFNKGYSNGDLDEVKSNEVNRVLSHIITVRPPMTELAFYDSSEIYIGTYAGSIQRYFVDKTFLENVYLGLETANFTFKENWDFDTITDRKTSLTYIENGNRLGNTSTYSFQTYKTLKLASVPNVSNYKISIYNSENNELLHVITSENKNETFEFPDDVRLIKIVTNELPKGQRFTMSLNVVKEIDSRQIVNDIPLLTFTSFGTISNSGRVYQSVNMNASNPYNGNASFSETYSNAKITTTTQSYTREISETSIPMTYTIKHNNVDAASKTWNEGYYLIKLPKTIIGIEDLNITPSDIIVSSEVIEKDGTNYIKILTNNTASSYNPNIVVNFHAIVNPKDTHTYGYVELYAINNTNTLYNNSVNDIYDVDGDGITDEKASYSSVYVSITAPNELLTGAIIKDYDDKGSETVSPLIADVDPTRENSDATVDVFIINNSSFRMKNITLVGKIAYKNNTYEGITGDLGSEYDAFLAGPIQAPSSLDGKVSIYYSTQKTPSRDLNNESNGWTTEVSDYSTIKSYMIIIDDDIVLNVGDTLDFEYSIDLPNSTENLLKETYFNHGVYFNRITDEGTRAGHVTAPKLGVRMARKYDLDLNVFKAYSDTKVPGGQYILTDSDGIKQTISLDSEGHSLVKGLYVDKEYTLVQHSAPYKYVLDKEERTFKVTNKDDDSLELTYDGEYRRIEYDDNNKLEVDLNMDVLYTLDLHNVDSESNADIKNTIFKVTGVNHENGTNIATDSYGHAYLNDMVIGEVYKIDQVKINDYAKVNSFNIKLERDPNTHEVKILVEEYPTITKADCHQIYNNLRDDGYIDSKSEYATSSGTYKCNLEIDLTRFRENYKFSGLAGIQDYIDSYNNPEASFSLTKGEQNVVLYPFLTVNKGNTSSTGWKRFSDNFSVTKAYEKDGNTYKEVDFKGGSKYYFTINYKHGIYYTTSPTYSSAVRVYIQNMLVRSTDSSIEFIFQDEKENVNPKDNRNVLQTIRNYSVNDTDNPILEVEVQNKYIEKATLEITKVDGETGEKLSGAQYKITGPGLPVKGKYVTIDDEGKGSVEVYLSYSGSTYYIPGINSNYPLSNYYTIEEVVPPTGYSVDDKPVTFQLVSNAIYDSNTQELNYNYSLNYDFNTNSNKFKSYEIDGDTKTWNVTMEDFPVVKVNKKDDETGEILPNTYYAVYKIERVDGTERTEFAKDSDGNYIGEKLIIDNEEYYVIKTDDNGSFSLNLPNGQYQLKEIQAADDKYEISDQITYFGVGETIPYQAAGLTLKRAILSIGAPTNERNIKIHTLSDGSYLAIMFGDSGSYSGICYLVKYDKDFNVKWVKGFGAQYKYDYYYTYFDSDKVYKDNSYSYTDTSIYYAAFREYDEGFYLGLDYNDLYLIDKDTGDVIKHSSDLNPGKYIYKYDTICDIPEGYTLETFHVSPSAIIEGNDSQYYCGVHTTKELNYYSYYDYEPHIAFADDGYVYVISKVRGNKEYGFELYDGTVVLAENVINPDEPEDSYNRYSDALYLLKMDIEGKIYEATNLTDKIHDAMVEYVEEKYPDLSSVITEYLDARNYTQVGEYYIAKNNTYMTYYKNIFRILPNGDIAFAVYTPLFAYDYKESSSTYSRTYTYSYNTVIVMDKNYNIKTIVPLQYKGNYLYFSSSSNYVDDEIIFNDDGSFEYAYTSSYELGREYRKTEYNSIDYYLNSADTYDFDLLPEAGNPSGYYSYVVFRWDKDGKADKIIELSRNQRNTSAYDTTNDMKRVYHFYEAYVSYAKVDDGYIVASPITSSPGLYTNSEPYRIVELASGETVKLNPQTSFIVYKVNEEDNSIEWIKQYGNIFTSRYAMNRINIVNNKFVIQKNIGTAEAAATYYDATDGERITSLNDPEHAKLTDTSANVAFLEFELLDEVAPAAPSSTKIELTNKRKEYKINVTNNEGGTFTITDEDNDVVYEGDEPGLIEKVKYGDDSLKTIKVKANRGYEIKSITVNGEDADITVNDDGSVIINKFTDVKEDKNINVTFERGMSRVTVHHYLKGTKEQISKDELLTGRIETSYTTEAKVTELYNLAKDDNGEYILPMNANGKFTIDPIEVTYYYEPNLVRVKTNFYLKDTSESLADSVIDTVILGSNYNTSPAEIPHYTVVDVLGVTSGIALDELTEVTYYYENTATGTVIIKYVDVDTEEEITEQKTKVIKLGEGYTTTKLNITPRGYTYSHSSNNTTGSIMEADEEIIVYYYYKAIKPVVTTRYVDYKTNKDLADKVIETYDFDSEYSTHELEVVPDGYKLKEIPSNYKGTADTEEIEVIYYYVKKEVKDVTEDNPETGDNITKYLLLILTSSIGLISTYKIKKKIN